MISLGIDVGGSSVKLAAVRDGAALWQVQSQTYSHPTREQLAAVIREAVAGRFGASDIVGICVPGRRDAGGRTVILSVNLPALNGLNLDALVRDAVGTRPTFVEVCTDALATAYDIYAHHNLRGRLLSLALGTGVGAAVVDEGGVPLLVDGESPGHIGQFDVSIEGHPVIGPDGGAGSLEGYIGAPALTKGYGPDMAATLRQLGPDDPPLRALARAVRICHAMYCMDHVALTGGLGNRMQHLLPAIRQLVEKDLTRIARPGWTLIAGHDDFHAAKGAAKFAAARAAGLRA